MKFFRDFMTVWRLVRRVKSAKNQSAFKWTAEDAMAMRGFLGSGVGRKFIQRIEWMRMELLARAVVPYKVGQEASSFKCGHANGFSEWVNTLQSFSAIPRLQQEEIPEEDFSEESDSELNSQRSTIA